MRYVCWCYEADHLRDCTSHVACSRCEVRILLTCLTGCEKHRPKHWQHVWECTWYIENGGSLPLFLLHAVELLLVVCLEVGLDVTQLLTLLQSHVEEIAAALHILILYVRVLLFESFGADGEQKFEWVMHVCVVHRVLYENSEALDDLDFDLILLFFLHLLEEVFEQVVLNLE